jgi:hypothetical protein
VQEKRHHSGASLDVSLQEVIDVTVRLGGVVSWEVNGKFTNLGNRHRGVLELHRVLQKVLVWREVHVVVPTVISDQVVGKIRSQLANVTPLTWICRTSEGKVQSNQNIDVDSNERLYRRLSTVMKTSVG